MSDDMSQPRGEVPTQAAPATAPDFSEIADTDPGFDPAALSILHDLTMPVAIELGRTRMSVQEILGLGRGSVIQLERLAGEPIDVFVGDRRFAEGEVVVVGEQFGVRVTRIVRPGRGDPEAAA
jgi:flagellar motor switch protein FliN